jgi:hypothetical protein
MTWQNNPVRLYHGTNTHVLNLAWSHPINSAASSSIAHTAATFRPNVRHGSRPVDFGQGFYTTTVLHQARQWANIGVKNLRLPIVGAIVLVFEVDRDALAQIDTLVFPTPSTDFFAFVRHCRRPGRNLDHRRGGAKQNYDVVYGPVSLGTQQLVIHGSDQISFHDQNVVDSLLGSTKVAEVSQRLDGLLR